MDRGTFALVKTVHEQRDNACSLLDVLTIIDKESGGIPVFRGGEPLFRQNLWAAQHGTGLPEAEIRQAITIPTGGLKGLWCKFRFEPAYWHDFAQPLQTRFPFRKPEMMLLSCSVGLGQQMLRFVVEKLPPVQMLARAYEFMGDLKQQIQWVVGNLNRNAAHGRQLMFARYNLASAVEKGKVYNSYGADCMVRSVSLEKFLRENHYL